MKTIVLTTDTTHHRFYAQELAKSFPIDAIVQETNGVKAPFETAHPFEQKREEYEKDFLLSGKECSFEDLTEVKSFTNVNNLECVEYLKTRAPDVLLVFGTGILRKDVIETPSVACLNLHGGNPEHYRGLDTHLWSIYHNDFLNITTTLHFVDSKLDTGNIVFMEQLKFEKNAKLLELRAVNTKACVNLSSLALSSLDKTGWLPSRKQVTKGRYYSFMPTDIKNICIKKFEKHTEKIS